MKTMFKGAWAALLALGAVLSIPAATQGEDTAAAFQNTYKKKGSPRIAVFLNRELSDDVREWSVDQRAVVSTTVQSEVATKGDAIVGGGDFAGKEGGASVYVQEHQDLHKERAQPGEGWMWEFEDGFLMPFMDAGVKIVDRATMMRLQAASTGKSAGAYHVESVKQIEMEALQGRVDYFIELLVRQSSTSVLGYEFKATVKEVKTGLLVANVTSRRWNKNKRYVAGGSGYETVKGLPPTSSGYEAGGSGYTAKLPSVSEVSEALAVEVMQALNNRDW